MVHGTVIAAERVKVGAMKKAEMEAFVPRREVHVDYEHGQHYS